MKRIFTINLLLFLFPFILILAQTKSTNLLIPSEIEPNNTAPQANFIHYGDSLTARISTIDDIDYYKFNANAGDTVDIIFTDINGSELDGMAYLYDATGNSLLRNDDFYSRTDSRIIFKILHDGLYYVKYSYFYSYTDYPNKPVRYEEPQIFKKLKSNGRQNTTIGDYSLKIQKFKPEKPLILGEYIMNVFENSAHFGCFFYPLAPNTNVFMEFGENDLYNNIVPGNLNPYSGFLYQVARTNQINGITTFPFMRYRSRAQNDYGSTTYSGVGFDFPEHSETWKVRMNIDTGYFINSNFFRVSFPTKDIGYAVGRQQMIYKTTNGGATWKKVDLPLGRDLSGVSFYDINHGAVSGVNSEIYVTSDGGVSWVDKSPPFSGFFNDIIMFDINNIITVTFDGSCIKTTDGGNNWNIITINSSARINSCYFLDKNLGFATGYWGELYKTENGGQNWVLLTTGITSNLEGVYFIDKNLGFVVGDDGTILKTSNGGTNWRVISSPVNSTWNSVVFSNEKNGIIVGLAGNIITTNDGGETWIPDKSGTYNDFNHVINRGAQNYIIAGLFNTILSSDKMISLNSPTAGNVLFPGTQYTINWTSRFVSNVKIEYSTNGGTTWLSVIPSIPASPGTFIWTVPNLTSTNCKIKVSDIDELACNSINSGTFSIIDAGVNILTPAGNEIWATSSFHNITWTSHGITTLTLDYSLDAGATWYNFPASIPAAAGSYLWQCPIVPTSYARLRLSDAANPVISSASNLFSIKAPNPVSELEPNNVLGFANAVAYGDSVLASINPNGDVDVYSFYALAGDTIDIFTGNRNGSDFDGRIYLLDSLGNIVANNDDYITTANSRLSFVITQSGRYFIRYAYYSNLPVTSARGTQNNEQPKMPRSPASTATGDYYLTFRKFATGTAVGNITFHDNIMYNSLRVGGFVFPNGLSTTVTVQYSTDLSYSNSVPIVQGTINGIASQDILSEQINGLLPNTRYNFRLMMTNSAGVSYSPMYQPITPEAPVEWQINNTGIEERLTSGVLLDQNTGYVAGDRGSILKTTNGGSSWVPQGTGITARLQSIAFANSSTGYIISSIGQVFKTTDGGQNWAPSSITPDFQDFYSISFANSNLGAAVSFQGRIYLTTNGGASWNQIVNPNTTPLWQVKFINSTIGFAVGSNGVILKTTNGGAAWSNKTSMTSRPLMSISFFDNLNGIAVGYGGTILRTTDCGETWTPLTLSFTRNINTSCCYSGNMAYVAGDWGFLAKSTDMGQTWVEKKSGTNNSLLGVSCFNEGAGILTGAYGYLAHLSASLSVTSPAGGESWIIGTNHNITWSSANVNNVKIEYSTNNGSTWLNVNSSSPASSGTFPWVIPNTVTTQAKVKISDADNALLFSISNTFRITGHGSFTEVEPNNSPAQANTIAFGDSVIASISSVSDVDYFSFTASAFDTVEIITNQRNTSGLSGLLILFSSSGVLINSSYYYTDYFSARIIYVVPSAGTYYIRFSSVANGNTFPNRPQKEKDLLIDENNDIKADIGDYSLVLRKFAPTNPAFGWIVLRNLNANSFRVEGSIYPMGLSTNVSVEYGTSLAYGNTAQATGNPYANTMQSVNAITNIISGLTPSTLYHYRFKAVNSAGTSYSPDMTFTTPQTATGWVLNTVYQGISFTTAKVFDQNNAFIAGPQGYKTTDAGITWIPSTGFTNYLYDLSFLDSNTGFGIGAAGLVVKTTNGGSSWTTLTTGITADLSSVWFTDVNNGFVLGRSNQALYKTTNSGGSWSQLPLPNITSAVKIIMANSSVGYVCGNNGAFAKTTDGGQTWALQTISGSPYLYDIYCRDANNLFVVGAGGTIIKSTNGGAAWTTISSGVTSILNRICFSDNTNGIIVGNDGIILRSTDGGNSWFKQNSGTTNIITYVSMANDLAIAVGSYSLILKSNNSLTLTSPVGGETWIAGSTRNITWSTVGVSSLKLEYSTNNGTNWNQIAASVPAGTGSYPWTLPLLSASQAKIKLTSSYDGTLTSVGNAFTISNRTSVTEAEPNNTAATANLIMYGDSVLASINPVSDVDYFKFYAAAGDTIDVFYSSLNGSGFNGKVKLYDSTGLYLWSTTTYNDFGTGVVTSKMPFNFTNSGYYYLRAAQNSNDYDFPNKPLSSGNTSASYSQNEAQPLETNAAGDYSIRLKKYSPEAPGFIYGTLDPVLSLNYNKAILRCLAFTNTLPTTITYEYGTTTSYGNSVSTANPVVPVLQYSLCTSSPITGLTGNTTYHFRIKAENSKGVTYTPDRTFTTPETPTNWIILNDQIGGTNSAVQVINENVMFVGKNTAIIKTTDGGNSWFSLPSSTGFTSIYGLCFTDANIGYGVGLNGFITKTTNSGASWTTQVSGTTKQLNSVSFIDQNNGFAVGADGTIIKTTNGGALWTTVASPTNIKLNKVKMIDVNNIVICGINGLFMKTTNGGLLWTTKTFVLNPELKDIFAADLQNYIVISSTGIISKSTNGGDVWNNIVTGTESYSGMSFSDANNGIIICGSGNIFRTNDSGNSWYKQNSGTANALNCISYVNNVALVGGGMVEFLKSGNYIHITSPKGGESWIAGSSYPINWAQAGITNVKVELSTDEGVNWQIVIASTPGNTGVYNWPIPIMPFANKCKIKVSDAANPSMNSISTGVFSIYSFPATPALVSPISNSTGQPVTPTLIWRSALNAAKYLVEVANDQIFNQIVLKDTVTADTSKHVTGLLNNTKYYWRVTALNIAGAGTSSAVWNFTTIPAAPLPPVIIAPSNNSLNIPVSTLFIWNSSATATSYHVQVSTDSLFGSFFYRDSTLTDTLKVIMGMSASTKYYWRICAKGAGGTGLWSSVTNFTTASPNSTIIGTLNYANTAKTPLKDVWVYLLRNSSIIDSVITNSSGGFTFSNLPNGQYSLSEKITKEWNGVNSTDALQIRRYLSGLVVLDSLQLKAADVNGSGSLNSTDALIIRRRLAEIITSFSISDWVTENPTLGLSGASYNINIRALCTGDVNGSYTPVTAKTASSVQFDNESIIKAVIGKVIELPIKATVDMEIGAVTLSLNYPGDLVNVESVKSSMEGFEYSVSSGKISIAWDNLTPLKLKAGDPLLVIKFKGTSQFTQGAKFNLTPGYNCELADPTGNLIKGAALKSASVEAFLPSELILEQNYPNPFNPSTSINYQTPRQGNVTLKVYDIIGNLVAVLVNQEQPAGSHTIQFNYNSKQIASGVYFYELRFQSSVIVRKMIILK